MPSVDLVDSKKQKTGNVNLSDDVFGVKVNSGLVHEAFLMQRANARQGTSETKTRHFVSGGGVKPYRQKGTGRARAGSSRSGLWRHGGIIFGPHPRDYSYSMPKKASRAALAAVLSAKVADGELLVMDKLTLEEPKTRAAAALFSSLGLTGSTLVLTSGADRSIYLAARNIPSVKVCRVENINIYDLLKYKNLLSDRESLEKLQEALS